MQARHGPLLTHALAVSLAAGCGYLAAAKIRCLVHPDAGAEVVWPYLAVGAAFFASLAFVAFWFAVAAARFVNGPVFEARSTRIAILGGALLGLTVLLLGEFWLLAVAVAPVAGVVLFRPSRTDAAR